MHHMTGAWHSMQNALRDVPVKKRRLLIDVDQTILLAGNDDDWHPQVGVTLTQSKRIGDHQSSFRGAGANL